LGTYPTGGRWTIRWGPAGSEIARITVQEEMDGMGSYVRLCHQKNNGGREKDMEGSREEGEDSKQSNSYVVQNSDVWRENSIIEGI
jgi:hypothetical protein